MTWAPVPEGSGFGLDHLPYGVARFPDGRRGTVARIGESVVELASAVDEETGDDLFATASLDALLAAGPERWTDVRGQLVAYLTDTGNERPLLDVDDVAMELPFTVGDYVDFYASIEHATNVGRIFRPDGEPLLPNWRHLPIGYHGRSASITVSGAPVRRPTGLTLIQPGAGDGPQRGPSRQLDFELEVGFVVGPGNDGAVLPPDEAAGHVFGAVLLNDWSARDIQSYEYQPLGPMLGKSFHTTVSPWVVPLAALEPFFVEPPAQEPRPDSFFDTTRPTALDLDLSVELNGTIITRTNARGLYWTYAQQLAHLTSNSSRVRPGDLFATGTVSGPKPGTVGSLLEATVAGRQPLTLDDGTERSFLEDGDTVTLRGTCGTPGDGPFIDFGAATGTITPATGPGAIS